MNGTGPLSKLKVLEIESLGPGPFAAMKLADLGASVLSIARPSSKRLPNPVLERGRAGRLELDLKSDEGRNRALALIEQADALIEGGRPGVMERLGLGPEVCLQRNPKLVYGRVTGWGSSGPLAQSAGHDINYIALSGALHGCGTPESGPIVPLNLVGDFGGGGMMLAFGLVAALFESKTSGRGQVVDTAMLDGAASLMSMMYGMKATGRWDAPRAGNILDGSAYFYTCYACSDGRWIAVGAIEPEFRKILFEKLGLAEEATSLMRAHHTDATVRARLAAVFLTRTRVEWQAVFEGSDACVSPVLAMDEVLEHPHNQAWATFSTENGVTHPNASPRFSRSAAPSLSPGLRGDLLSQWQIDS
jgi:alpha-methylacyl-CoA racemase